MNETKDTFNEILNEEEETLINISQKQSELKLAVKEKNWEKLTGLITEINIQTDKFQDIDKKRDDVQKTMKVKEIQPYFEKLGELRKLLLRCKIENQALGRFVNIARDFVKEVVDNALPQSRSKLYSKKGVIVQPQPKSVVLNQLF